VKSKKSAKSKARLVPVRPPTTPIMRAVDQHYILRLLGEPDGSFVFDAGRKPLPYEAPRMLDVPYWVDEDPPLTRIATIGMSEVAQAGGVRTELHLAIARSLDEEERGRLSVFLANFASYPFAYGVALRRSNFIPELGEIPLFPRASGVLLDALDASEDDQALFTAADERIDLHQVVPITPAEIALCRAEGPDALRADWESRGTHRFDPARGQE
jgi:hypothetical protein